MTLPEMQRLKALISATGAYYGQIIDDDVLVMYVNDLSDLPFTRVIDELESARRDPKNARFPLPAVIRNRIQPQDADSDEIRAHMAASRIPEAVAKFGWNNPAGARAHMGELAWQVIERDGGWRQLCQTLNSENIGMLKAQWRNQALVEAKRARAGLTHVAPALPSPMGSTGLTKIDFNKLLTSKVAMHD